MAYVRKRITKAGTSRPVLSKAIATRRDARDSACSPTCAAPPDTLRALAQLAVRRANLLAERKPLASGKAIDDETNEVVDAALACEVIGSIDTKLFEVAREQTILATRRPRKFGLRRKPTGWAEGCRE